MGTIHFVHLSKCFCPTFQNIVHLFKTCYFLISVNFPIIQLKYLIKTVKILLKYLSKNPMIQRNGKNNYLFSLTLHLK